MTRTVQCMDIMCGAFVPFKDARRISGATYCRECKPVEVKESTEWARFSRAMNKDDYWKARLERAFGGYGK